MCKVPFIMLHGTRKIVSYHSREATHIQEKDKREETRVSDEEGDDERSNKDNTGI